MKSLITVLLSIVLFHTALPGISLPRTHLSQCILERATAQLAPNRSVNSFHHFGKGEAFRMLQPNGPMTETHHLSTENEVFQLTLSYSDHTGYLLGIFPLSDDLPEEMPNDLTLCGFPAAHEPLLIPGEESEELLDQWNGEEFIQALIGQNLEIHCFSFLTEKHWVWMVTFGVQEESMEARAKQFAHSLEMELYDEE